MNASSEETKTIADVQAAPQQQEPSPAAAVPDKPVDAVEEKPATATENETKAPLKVEIPARAVDQSDSKHESDHDKEDDGIVRISNKSKNYRAQIGYLMSRLNAGKSVSLQAYGHAVNKAILLSSIVRTKLGDIHQTVSLAELKEEKRESAGIKILLSKDAPSDLTDVGYQKAEPKGFWVRKQRPARKDAPQKKSENSDKKDGEEAVKKVVEDDANNKSVARSTRSQSRRSQSSRRARDKQSQTAVEVKPATTEAKIKSVSPRRESRRRKPNSKAKEEQKPAELPAKKQQKPIKKVAEAIAAPEETKKSRGQRSNRRRERSAKKDEHSSDQKENIKVQAKPAIEKKARGAAGKGELHESVITKQTSFQKSWAQDEDVFLYEGGHAKRSTAEREQREQPRRGRGSYQGGGMGRRPPQYATDYYPPMRGPYFPQGQDYYMMRPPYQQQYLSYYNQPGYQKGHNTREIGQKPQPGYQQRRGNDSGEPNAAGSMRREQGRDGGYYQQREQQREQQRGQNFSQPTSHGGQHESSSHYVL